MDALDQQDGLEARLKAAFAKSLPIPPQTEPRLAQALRDTLGRPGSFVRAELAANVAGAFGMRENGAIGLAIAVEYFHTASLLFDDLPSMDDATYRRGAVCVHRTYGEGTAILAALGLVNRAYALLWRAAAQASTPASAERGLHYVEQYLGLRGLLDGQSRDLQYGADGAANPQAVALGKTVSLVRLSLVLPAVFGGADRGTVRRLDRLAVLWGLAYQGVDDLRDLLQSTEATGKTTARDALLHRPNLAMARGREEALGHVHRLLFLSRRAVQQLQAHNPELLFLDALQQRFQGECAEIEALQTQAGPVLAAEPRNSVGPALVIPQ